MGEDKIPKEFRKELLYGLESLDAKLYHMPIMILNNDFYVFTKKGNHGVELCPKCLEKLKWLFDACIIENTESKLGSEKKE